MYSQISNGDILSILVSKNSSTLEKLISFWEGFPVFHSCISFWQGNELFVFQMDPNGYCVVPISHYIYNDIHVLKKPKNVKFDILEQFYNVSQYNYSFIGAFKAGISQYLPGLFKSRAIKKKFCSQYCIDVWKAGGFIYNNSDIIDPAMLERQLLNRGIQMIVIKGE